MKTPAEYLSPAEAAMRLGVSAKALRVYERRGLVSPTRTATGWRVYSQNDLVRAAKVVGLRDIGLSLGEIATVLGGDAQSLGPILTTHQVVLEGRIRQLAGLVEKVGHLRAGLSRSRPGKDENPCDVKQSSALSVEFALPWPWGGERFEL